MPKAPAPTIAPKPTVDPMARVASEASVGASVIAPLLVACQETHEAIGLVECSTPDQLSAAMARLLSARRSMDDAVERLVRAFARSTPCTTAPDAAKLATATATIPIA